MYALAEHHDSRETRGDRETMPYVVRDLSWALARYLETQDFPEGASPASNTADGGNGWIPDEQRLAG
jgi:hypothetical protein